MNYSVKRLSHPIIHGTASVLDIGGTLGEYTLSKNGMDQDAKAIKSDWQAVGKDLVTATKAYAKKTTKAPNK